MKEVNINQIARMADCSTPEGDDTDGAKFLRECFNEAQDMKSEFRGRHDGDLIHEIADGLVPIYTNELWNVWVDCGGYHFDGTYRDFSSHGDTSDTMNRVAQADCYEWARNIVATVALQAHGIFKRDDY